METLTTILLIALVALAVAAFTRYSRGRQDQDYGNRPTTNVFEVGFRWRGPGKRTRWQNGSVALAAGAGRLRINQSTLHLDLANTRAPTALEQMSISSRLRIVAGTDPETGAEAEVALFPSDIRRLMPEGTNGTKSQTTDGPADE